MNIYQKRHTILARHLGKRISPAQLKAELLEEFPDTKPQSVNAPDCFYSDRKLAGSTCPECQKLGGFAVNRDGIVDVGASGWGGIPPSYMPSGNTRSSTRPSTTTNRSAFFRSPQNAVIIDDAFISDWHPKYDRTENDEDEYQKLVTAVSRDIASAGTVSRSIFLRI